MFGLWFMTNKSLDAQQKRKEEFTEYDNKPGEM